MSEFIYTYYIDCIQRKHVFCPTMPEAWSSTSCHTFSDLGSCVLPVDAHL